MSDRKFRSKMNVNLNTMKGVNKKKKGPYQPVDFVIPADHRFKIKENENIDKYIFI